MNRMATAYDFHQLNPTQQGAHGQVLLACQDNKLSCRCEMVDERDFTIVVAPGLSAAKWWIDRLDIDV